MHSSNFYLVYLNANLPYLVHHWSGPLFLDTCYKAGVTTLSALWPVHNDTISRVSVITERFVCPSSCRSGSRICTTPRYCLTSHRAHRVHMLTEPRLQSSRACRSLAEKPRPGLFCCEPAGTAKKNLLACSPVDVNFAPAQCCALVQCVMFFVMWSG